MNHTMRTTVSFTFFGWTRFTEAGYFGMEKTGTAQGYGDRIDPEQASIVWMLGAH